MIVEAWGIQQWPLPLFGLWMRPSLWDAEATLNSRHRGGAVQPPGLCCPERGSDYLTPRQGEQGLLEVPCFFLNFSFPGVLLTHMKVLKL